MNLLAAHSARAAGRAQKCRTHAGKKQQLIHSPRLSENRISDSWFCVNDLGVQVVNIGSLDQRRGCLTTEILVKKKNSMPGLTRNFHNRRLFSNARHEADSYPGLDPSPLELHLQFRPQGPPFDPQPQIVKGEARKRRARLFEALGP